MEKLFEGEYRVMEVLWDSGPVSSTQLVSPVRRAAGLEQEHYLHRSAAAKE